MNNNYRTLVLGCLGIVLASCGLVYDESRIYVENNYFQDRLNQATRDLVAKRYGPANRVEFASDGGQVWIYIEQQHSYFLNTVSTICISSTSLRSESEPTTSASH